jgi:hypothetical protein
MEVAHTPAEAQRCLEFLEQQFAVYQVPLPQASREAFDNGSGIVFKQAAGQLPLIREGSARTYVTTVEMVSHVSGRACNGTHSRRPCHYRVPNWRSPASPRPGTM